MTFQFPVVSSDTCESIKNQLKQDSKYLERLLDEIRKENPEIGDFIVSTSCAFADLMPERYGESMEEEALEDLKNLVRGNFAWTMCAVYNSIKQQAIINELNSN